MNCRQKNNSRLAFGFANLRLGLLHTSVIALLLIATFCTLLCAQTPTPAPPPPTAPWWNNAWPFRVRLQCPAGESDVAQVTVPLAGRTTSDGHDLRLIDAQGHPIPFEILFHDPLADSLIAFRAEPNAAQTFWLYFGNTTAPVIDTTKDDGTIAQSTLDAWKKSEQDREALVTKRNRLQEEITNLTYVLSHQQPPAAPKPTTTPASATANTEKKESTSIHQRIAKLQSEIKALNIPPAQTQPLTQPDWVRQRGIVLKVFRKARNENPKTVEEFQKLLADSKLEGAGFRDNISDGFNPFGPSVHCMSTYEGFLKIEKPGLYEFCTVSDDGSYVVINDKKIVEWLGGHGWGGGERGEHHGQIELPAGVAKIQYFHEQAVDNQLAYLGWKAPGDKNFTPIPPALWLSVRRGQAFIYEAQNQPLVAMPITRMVNSYWLRDQQEKQATLVDFTDQSHTTTGKITQRTWSFGDGSSGTGEKIEHVYFRVNRPTVTLTVQDDHGHKDSVTCSPRIFQVSVTANYFQYASPDQYANIVKNYDPAALDREGLRGICEFWLALERWPELAKAASLFVERFTQDPLTSTAARVAADAMLHTNAFDPQKAEKLLALAIDKATNPLDENELMLLRGDVLAWELGQPEAAAPLYEAVYQASKQAAQNKKTQDLVNQDFQNHSLKNAKPLKRRHANPPADRTRDLARRSLVGLGDVALLCNDAPTASALYQEARELDQRKIAKPEEMAKIGTFPFTVEDLLARGEHDYALHEIDEWETLFPSEKLSGLTTYWRGKVLFVQKPSARALRYLDITERINPKAVHIPETVWLRANCLLAMKQFDQALIQFQRIRSEFTATEFFAKSNEKILECQKQIPKP